jgi:hypothetical protein
MSQNQNPYLTLTLSMNRLLRASCLDWRKLALTPALSPRRGRIVVRWFETPDVWTGSRVPCANDSEKE